MNAKPIPKGLRPPAQGCEQRATLGPANERDTTPTGLRPAEDDRGHKPVRVDGDSPAVFRRSPYLPMIVGYRVKKLDDFLKLPDRELLNHAGKITAEAARTKAEREYDHYRALRDAQPRPVDTDFEQAVKQLLPSPKPADRILTMIGGLTK